VSPSREAAPRVPDYELIRLIGRGSYGDVWLARSVTGAFRAIKFVWRDRFVDLRPYEREFEGITRFTAVSLREPSQLALLHVGRDEAASFFYYVMELADDAAHGRDIRADEYVPLTLSEVRKRRGRVPPGEVVALGVALARALASLHVAGLVHRDIKPSNVVFVGGVPKLADVGLVAEASAGLTFVGTEGYVPPEGPGAPSADVFSLGKVLYELATGLDRHEYPRLPANLDAIPDRKELIELNEVIIRACEPDARARFNDAAALLDELLLLQAGKSVRRLRNAERRTARALRIAAALALIAGVAGTGAWIERTIAQRESARRQSAEAALVDLTRRTYYTATLARAQRALETEEFGLARRLLQELIPANGEPDLRGFEWRALWKDAQGDPALVARTGGEPVRRIELSSDQRLIAGQVGDAQAIIWDAATLAEVRRIPGPRLVGGFSADSRWLVGTNHTQALQRWQLATGEPDPRTSPDLNYAALPLGADRVVALVKDPRGFAIGARLWDFSRQKEELALPLAVPDPGNWLFMSYPAVTADGARCAVALWHRTESSGLWRLQVYDLPTRRLAYEQAPAARATALALSPDAKLLAVALADTGMISVRDLATDSIRWEQPAKMSVVDALAFSPAGDRLLVGGRASFVRLLAARDGEELGVFRGHETGALALRWTADGHAFFSAGSGGDLRRWEITPADSAPTRTGYLGHTVDPQTLCVSDDGALFAAACDSDLLQIESIHPAAAPRRQVPGRIPLAFTSADRHLVALTAAGALRVYQLAGEPALVEEHPLLPAGSLVSCALLSANGEILIATSRAGEIWFWNYPRREPIKSIRTDQTFMWIVASPDGKTVVTNARDNVIRVWAGDRGEQIAEFRDARRAFGAALSPDGRTLALGFETGEVEIHRLGTREVLRRFRTDSQSLTSLAYSPDGTRLFCGGPNGAVHVYNTDGWRLIVTLTMPAAATPHDTGIMGLAASARGDALLAYRADGAIRIWQLE
jgi:WD40 repeat protein